jgi:hypothetical protein
MTRQYLSHFSRPFILSAAKSAGMVFVVLAIAGCGMTMEDGYKPRSLGASPEVRKSYYASPFSDQAEAGAHEAEPAVHAGAPGSH